MSEFKGTPGPWFDGSTSMKRYDITGQDGRTICQIEANDETDDFNFMLVVSAPELLELVMHVRNCVENDGSYEPANLDYFNAIIAKALGETK